jgi:hypothetical protein
VFAQGSRDSWIKMAFNDLILNIIIVFIQNSNKKYIKTLMKM